MKKTTKTKLTSIAAITTPLPTEKEKVTNQTLRSSIKLLSLEWILASTSHGLPNIFRTDQIYLKVLWLIFFIASFSVCTFVVVNYLILFFAYNTNVNIAINTESPTYFPAITICNLNPFYKKRSQTYLNNILIKNGLGNLINLNSMSQNNSAFSLMYTAQTVLKTAIASDLNLTSSQRKMLGWGLEEMLMSCQFNGITCSVSDFVWIQDYDYLNCYKYNSGFDSNGNKTTMQQINNAGPGSGLQMELFVGDDSNDADFVYTSGVYIVVHNQSVTPLIESEGIHAATGLETNIAIDRTFTKKLPSPYSECLENNTSPNSFSSSLYKAIFDTLNQKTYRQKYCYRLCYQQLVINNCGCSDASLPNPFTTRDSKTISFCISTSELSCLSTTKVTFQNSPISTQCSSYCPLECSSVSYSCLVSIATYPTSFYSNWLQLQSNVLQRFQNNQTSSAKLESSMVKLNIFYNSMSYTSIAEIPAITWDTLLGNIGGQLGLFLGISVLSLAEIIEIIAEIIRLSLAYKKRRKIQENGLMNLNGNNF